MPSYKIQELDYEKPPTFGDPTQNLDWERRYDAQKEVQAVMYSPAPMCAVVSLRTGKKITEGQELTLEDLGNNREVMRRLVAERVVVFIHDDELAKRRIYGDADYLVGPKALSTRRRGILPPGVPIEAADLAEEPEAERVDVHTGFKVAARPGSDGSKAFAHLIARGLVVPNANKNKASAKGRAAHTA